MPRKSAINNEQTEEETTNASPVTDNTKEEIENLNRMLGAVLTYLSDDEIEEIDIESLLNNTMGLREWWDKYREKNRKRIEEEIKKSLGDLSLEELESIREKIKEKKA